jgi:hypothetical protein
MIPTPTNNFIWENLAVLIMAHSRRFSGRNLLPGVEE